MRYLTPWIIAIAKRPIHRKNQNQRKKEIYPIIIPPFLPTTVETVLTPPSFRSQWQQPKSTNLHSTIAALIQKMLIHRWTSKYSNNNNNCSSNNNCSNYFRLNKKIIHFKEAASTTRWLMMPPFSSSFMFPF